MSWTIWITGVPGSGKSTIARAAAAELAARDERVQILELDSGRPTLAPWPTSDDAEGEAQYRALVAIARMLTGAGQSVIIDAAGHRREWRDLARASIDDFAEVQLVCPLEVARERARAGDPNALVAGADVAYEPAIAPELTIDTTRVTAEEAGARVAALARELARRPRAPAAVARWTLWVTGRPGSGKTTVVSRVCERLQGRGIPVAVLDPAELATTIVPRGLPSRRQREIVTHAVVRTAKLLSESGVAVIIEGASPTRGGGRLARELLGHFAEVELACPPDICRTRERAVRWNLVPCPRAPRSALAPDLGLDYEPPVTPDLVLYTHVLDEQATADEILRVVDRLERAIRNRRRSCT